LRLRHNYDFDLRISVLQNWSRNSLSLSLEAVMKDSIRSIMKISRIDSDLVKFDGKINLHLNFDVLFNKVLVKDKTVGLRRNPLSVHRQNWKLQEENMGIQKQNLISRISSFSQFQERRLCLFNLFQNLLYCIKIEYSFDMRYLNFIVSWFGETK
jgi:hypothetical protein